MPKRIQRKRTKGWRMPDNTVYVGRGSRWGNMYIVGEQCMTPWGDDILVRDNAHAARLFRTEMVNDILLHRPDYLEPLRGKDLACWCRLDQACHADVLLELANK